MILIGQLENRLSRSPTSSARPLGSGDCRQLAAIVARLVAGWRIERACGKYGEAIVARLPEQRDEAIGPSRVLRAGEPAYHLELPHREAARTLGGYFARLDFLRAVRIRHVRQVHFPAMCP